MNASQSPLTTPAPSSGIEAPKTIERPAKTNSHPMSWPTPAAQRVAFWRSFVAAHRIERRIRPPSSGKPGIRLKSPRRTLIGPSHRKSVGTGPRPARKAVGSARVERARAHPERPESQEDDSDHEARQGPDERHEEFRRGGGRLALEVGDPSEQEQRDPVHGQPAGARDDAVTELVGENRGEEEERRDEGGDESERGAPVGVHGREPGHEAPRDEHEDEEPARVDLDVDPEDPADDEPASRPGGSVRRSGGGAHAVPRRPRRPFGPCPINRSLSGRPGARTPAVPGPDLQRAYRQK